MPRNRPALPALLPFLLLLPLLAGLSACGSDSQTAPPADDPPAGIQTDHTDPVALLEAYEAALTAKDLEAYTALLEPMPPPAPGAGSGPAGRAEPGFRFIPQSADVDDFPWLNGGDWDLEDELGMIGHMFDPTFVSDQTQDSIDTIEADIAITAQTDLGNGEIEVTTSALITVLWAAETGAAVDVRLVHVLAADEDGFLRIREQQELPPFGPRVEDASWGSIKSLYR